MIPRNTLPTVALEGSSAESLWLAQAVERLRAQLQPRLVLLFGSRARGTATAHSDLDLFLVCETEDPPLERIGRVLGILRDAPWPVEPIVYTPAELDAARHRPFIQRVLREGKVLYEQ